MCCVAPVWFSNFDIKLQVNLSSITDVKQILVPGFALCNSASKGIHIEMNFTAMFGNIQFEISLNILGRSSYLFFTSN